MRLDNIEKMLHCIFWLLFLLHIRLFPAAVTMPAVITTAAPAAQQVCADTVRLRQRAARIAGNVRLKCLVSTDCRPARQRASVQRFDGNLFYCLPAVFLFFFFNTPFRLHHSLMFVYTDVPQKKALKHNPLLNTF